MVDFQINSNFLTFISNPCNEINFSFVKFILKVLQTFLLEHFATNNEDQQNIPYAA